MYHKIREAQQGDREEGFTLIELLVVVIIIGILAAIAIPVFLNQREKARNAAANSDLRNLVTAQEAFYTDNDRYAIESMAFDGTNAGADAGQMAANGMNTSSDVAWCTAPTTADPEVFIGKAVHQDGTVLFTWNGTEITKTVLTSAATAPTCP